MKNISLILFSLLAISSLKAMDKSFGRDDLVDLCLTFDSKPLNNKFRPIRRVKREHCEQWYRELFFGEVRDCGVDSPTKPNTSPVPTPEPEKE